MKHTMKFLTHIFGAEKLEIGLDYIQLLHQKPAQNLPVLCLVSKHASGKSTFAKWLEAIWSGSAVMLIPSDWRRNFNSDLNNFLIITEETVWSRNLIETVKILHGADRVAINQKRQEPTEIDFYGKLIFLSQKAPEIGENEIRFWIIKPSRIWDCNPGILNQIVGEIPQFIEFLNNRTMATEQKNRQWFDYRLTAPPKMPLITMNRAQFKISSAAFSSEITADQPWAILEHMYKAMYVNDPEELEDRLKKCREAFTPEWREKVLKEIEEANNKNPEELED